LIAYLTTNTFIYGGVSLSEIDASCTFYSSTPSTEVQLPLSPSWVVASDGIYTDKIAVSWGAVSGVSYYNIYYADSLTGTKYYIDSTTNTFMDIVGATPDKIYYFWISSVNAGGEGALSSSESGYIASTLDNISPTGSVSYSTTDPTNGSVIATLQTSEDVTITSSGGNSHTFTDNGSFTFSFQDAAGNTGSAIATVSNIDKIAPTVVLTGAPSGIATLNTFEISVSGGDVIQYRFTLDNGVYGSITDVGINISLNNLTEGPHTLYVIGKDSADNWQAEIDATIVSWEIVFLGNVNGDDKVDLVDAIIALKVLSGIDTTGFIRSDYAASGADVNGDNKIGMQEVVYILERVSGLR